MSENLERLATLYQQLTASDPVDRVELARQLEAAIAMLTVVLHSLRRS